MVEYTYIFVCNLLYCMKKLLLLDDDKKYLANLIEELKLAGCEIKYVNSSQDADAYIKQEAQNLGMVIVALNNALGYPAVRKIKRSISSQVTLSIFSDSDGISLREWVYKQNIKNFYSAPHETKELIDLCKKVILNKNIHFSHKQLLGLYETLSKYTDSADNLVQQHAANSNSIQELQHKLARSLTNYEHQKSFLTEVQ